MARRRAPGNVKSLATEYEQILDPKKAPPGLTADDIRRAQSDPGRYGPIYGPKEPAAAPPAAARPKAAPAKRQAPAPAKRAGPSGPSKRPASGKRRLDTSPDPGGFKRSLPPPAVDTLAPQIRAMGGGAGDYRMPDMGGMGGGGSDYRMPDMSGMGGGSGDYRLPDILPSVAPPDTLSPVTPPDALSPVAPQASRAPMAPPISGAPVAPPASLRPLSLDDSNPPPAGIGQQAVSYTAPLTGAIHSAIGGTPQGRPAPGLLAPDLWSKLQGLFGG